MTINVERFNTIFGKMNEIFDIHTRSQNISSKEYINSLGIYCSMLTDLTNEKGLGHILETVEEKIRDQEVYSQAREIFRKTESFVEFLALEKELLESAGVSSALANYLADKQAFIRGLAISDLDDLAAARNWVEGIQTLAKVTCAAADETDGKSRWLKIKKYSTFASGWTIITANGAGGLLGTLSGAPAVAVPAAIASIVLGRTIVKLSDEM